MSFDFSYLELLLQKAKYEQALGARTVKISKTEIGKEAIVLLEVKVAKGTDIAPHFHEHNGEICIPLTTGKVRFGRVEKDKDGKYKMDGEKVVTSWDVMEQDLQPGKPFEVPEGVAHHFVALEDSPAIILFVLPNTHATAEERKFSTYPEGSISKQEK
ncbi:MAG: cupin domain-containing protein [Candidatus Levyibacteriota bacterium]